MKPPISYYGGKQKMARHILPLIPAHETYVEPFFGGGVIFFAKKPVKTEVINDINNNAIAFYRVLKGNFEALHREIDCTLHSEAVYRFTKEIYKNPEKYNDLQVAYSFWVQCNLSFGKKPMAGFAFNDRGDRYMGAASGRLTSKASERLKNAYIFCRDALELINLYNKPGVFMYLDPPYPEGDCGHYEEHKGVYYELLELLPSLKCNWLLSSYPSDGLTALRLQYGWSHQDIDKNLSVDGRRKESARKTECLTWNYDFVGKQYEMF